MKIGIIGYGHVGKAMKNLFQNAQIYDKYLKIGSIEEINKCEAIFVCVPTPQNKNGSCDTSIVEEIIKELKSKIIILRSTISIGFTDYLAEKYQKNIVFQPEYFGETVAHPFKNLNNREWITLGGDEKAINLAISVYQTVINSNVKIYQCSSKEAEMAKYMENSYFALKVTFCNEMYDICQKKEINYNKVREVWLADPRIGSYHTFVYENKRGYSGSCLPKDLSSLEFQAKEENIDTTLISAIIEKNKKYGN